MKNTVRLLNKLECKYFEEIYQCLKNYPEWEMKNIFNEKTLEYEEFKIFPQKIYTKDKNIRLSVAAHEAGHAIVMVATHGSVDMAAIDIRNDPGGRIGFVMNQANKAAKDYRSIKQDGMPLMPLVKIDTLIEAGGFVGQSFVGKKTGSNHEKFLVYCRCRHFDDLEGFEPLNNWAHYVEWCRKIILNNEKLFWKVIDELLTNSTLTDSIKTLLNNTTEKEPTELFFN